MAYLKDRYTKYKRALALAVKLPELTVKHADWPTCHARVLYDYLHELGWYWWTDEKTWTDASTAGQKKTRRKPSPTAGIPPRLLFKVRIIAHNSEADALSVSTRALYEMADCECLRQSKPKECKFLDDHCLIYFDFRLPR
jgi:hypothetical protein